MSEAIRELSDQQLVFSVLEIEREFIAARFKHSTNQLENTAQLRDMRRRVARLHTEARRREMFNGLPKDSLIHQYRRGFGGVEVSTTDDSPEKGGFMSSIVDKLTAKE
jgi:large subunit ribosomal protein L29